jgi:hypothetical protein
MIRCMTSANIKRARAMVPDHREILCREANIPLSTWSRLESYGDQVPGVSIDTMARVEDLFFRRGIAFLPPGGVERIGPSVSDELETGTASSNGTMAPAHAA